MDKFTVEQVERMADEVAAFAKQRDDIKWRSEADLTVFAALTRSLPRNPPTYTATMTYDGQKVAVIDGWAVVSALRAYAARLREDNQNAKEKPPCD